MEKMFEESCWPELTVVGTAYPLSLKGSSNFGERNFLTSPAQLLNYEIVSQANVALIKASSPESVVNTSPKPMAFAASEIL